MNYYDYELKGTFYDSDRFLINKIEVIPKRPNDKVFSGHIYIIEETWEVFGVELKTTGKSLQIERKLTSTRLIATAKATSFG